MGAIMEGLRAYKAKYDRNASYRKIKKEAKAKAEGAENSNGEKAAADFNMNNLQNKEFVAFMEKTFGDIHDLDADKAEDNKKLRERWDAFETRRDVAIGLNEIYKDTFKGLAEIDPQAIQDKIGIYLEEILENNPGKLPLLKKRVEDFKKHKTALNNGKWKTRLQENGDLKIDEGEKLRLLFMAQGGKNIFSRLFQKSDKLAVQRLKEEFGVQFEDIDNQLASAQEALPGKAVNEIEFSINKAQFNAVRKRLMGEMSVAAELGKMASDMMANRLIDVYNDRGNKSVDELHKVFTETQKVFKDGEGRNLILEGNSPAYLEGFQKYLGNFDKALQDKFMAELADTIANNDSEELIKALEPFLKKGALGSKTQMQIRKDVRKAIEDAAKTADPTKKYLLTTTLATNKYLIA